MRRRASESSTSHGMAMDSGRSLAGGCFPGRRKFGGGLTRRLFSGEWKIWFGRKFAPSFGSQTDGSGKVWEAKQ
eukprot:3248868-Rhodomonas_salina.1